MTALATRQTALTTLTNKLAANLDMGENGIELIDTLKQTAFKGPVTDAQMTALMVVANQYGLNPWTREIYAFPDRQNGIVPVVGVDGWARIINDHPQFDGLEFAQDSESCTCSIYRKDRSRATSVTEYLAECRRDTQPWKSHPRRMMRHKAMIQAARLAFGYGGIFDQDEAERIVERNMGPAEVIHDEQPATTSRTEAVKAALAGRGKAKVSTTAPMPVAASDASHDGPDLPMVLTLIRDAGTEEELHGAGEMAGRLTSTADKDAARAAYKARKEAMRQEAEEEARLEREAIQAEAEATDSSGSAI